MRFNVDSRDIAAMEASWSFRPVKQNANATVGARKAHNQAGLTAAFGTAFDAQRSKLKSGSQLEVPIFSFDGHFIPPVRVSGAKWIRSFGWLETQELQKEFFVKFCAE